MMTMNVEQNGATQAVPSPTPQLSPAPLALRQPEQVADGAAISAFASAGNFQTAQRIAKALSESTMVPLQYRNNVPNCLIAIEMASRIGASVMAVCQNLDIIHGRPGWRSTFLIATVNASRQFTKLRYRWEGKEGRDDWGCRAVARERETNEECVGPRVTVGMAKAEGWYSRIDKNGRESSKWPTLTELMLIYRSSAFWQRVFCPELSLGMQTREEIIDVHGEAVVETPMTAVVVPNGSSKALEAALLGAPVVREVEPAVADVPSVVQASKPDVPQHHPRQVVATSPVSGEDGADHEGAEAYFARQERRHDKQS